MKNIRWARRALIVLLLWLGFPAGRVLADGMILGPRYVPIWEHEQLAFVDWDEGAGVESLTVLPGFYGSAREFAWVVPVPAAPEVSPAPRALFTELSTLTAPRHSHRDDGWDCGGTFHPDVAGAPGDVEVLTHDLVGYYDVLVLGAGNAAALGDTLAAWGFLHDDNRALVAPLLDDYVRRDWVFVAMRVDSTAFAAAYPGIPPGQDYYGGLAPLTLRFAAAAPVYPMRLSAAGAAWNTWVGVYVCAAHRMTMSGATTVYANRFDDGEWEVLDQGYPTVAARLGAGRFLTRLEMRLDPDEMTADLPLARAATDTEYREIRYGSFPLFSVFVGTWAAVWTVGKLRRRRAASGGH